MVLLFYPDRIVVRLVLVLVALVSLGACLPPLLKARVRTAADGRPLVV